MVSQTIPLRLKRPTRRFLVGVVALSLLVLGASEYVLRHVVTDRLAGQVSCRLHQARASLTARVVTPRVIDGDLGEVRVEGQVQSADRPSATAELRLEGVRVGSFGTGSPSAASGSAEVTVAWPDVESVLPADGTTPPVTLGARNGDLLVQGPGFSVDAAVGLADGDAVRIRPRTLLAGGRTIPVARVLPLIEQHSPQMARRLEPRDIALSALPPGVNPTRVRALDQGLVLDADLDPTTLLATGGTCR